MCISSVTDLWIVQITSAVMCANSVTDLCIVKTTSGVLCINSLTDLCMAKIATSVMCVYSIADLRNGSACSVHQPDSVQSCGCCQRQCDWHITAAANSVQSGHQHHHSDGAAETQLEWLWWSDGCSKYRIFLFTINHLKRMNCPASVWNKYIGQVCLNRPLCGFAKDDFPCVYMVALAVVGTLFAFPAKWLIVCLSVLVSIAIKNVRYCALWNLRSCLFLESCELSKPMFFSLVIAFLLHLLLIFKLLLFPCMNFHLHFHLK